MADPSLLASIISGTSPLAPQMLGAYQGAQLSSAALDPNFAHNEGPFGALAKLVAGLSGPGMLQRGVEQTTAANVAAQPELAKLLAGPDPYAALAANQQTNPLVSARLLAGATPGSVAEARKAAAEAALGAMNVKGFQNASALAGAGQPISAVPAAKNAGSAIGATSPAVFGTGRYPNADVDPLATIAAMPPAQQAAAIAKLTPAQKMMLWAKLKGGSGALRPPT